MIAFKLTHLNPGPQELVGVVRVGCKKQLLFYWATGTAFAAPHARASLDSGPMRLNVSEP